MHVAAAPESSVRPIDFAEIDQWLGVLDMPRLGHHGGALRSPALVLSNRLVEPKQRGHH
jgi:hypothetical protein